MEQLRRSVHDQALLRRLFPEGPLALDPGPPDPAPLRPPRRKQDVPAADPGSGHRARLRKRLFEGGPDALLDHELVEYLLALAIPRRDTKPLAKRLIREFGGIGPLLAADAERIIEVGKVSETVAATLKIAHAAANRMLEAPIRGCEVLSSWQALLDYLRANMAHEPIERVRVLFLNAKNVLIANELMTEGSIDESAVYIRDIVQRALELRATALIVVHNHPSGDSSPSSQDIRITRDLIEAGRPLKVTVHDHVVVGANGVASLRSMGLI